jgi:hypothetical protein
MPCATIPYCAFKRLSWVVVHPSLGKGQLALLGGWAWAPAASIQAVAVVAMIRRTVERFMGSLEVCGVEGQAQG